MNRREALKFLGGMALLAGQFKSKTLQAMFRSQTDANPLVLIYDSKSETDYRNLLWKAGTFLDRQDLDWRQRLEIWDVQTHAEQIRAFVKKYGPATRTIQYPILVSVPNNAGPLHEVEIWTWDWMRSGDTGFVDVCYPVSGSWWSVEGDWHPTLEKVRNHLTKSPNHAGGKFDPLWIEKLKLEEIQSLHSDHHREMTGHGKVVWKDVNVECPKPEK